MSLNILITGGRMGWALCLVPCVQRNQYERFQHENTFESILTQSILRTAKESSRPQGKAGRRCHQGSHVELYCVLTTESSLSCNRITFAQKLARENREPSCRRQIILVQQKDRTPSPKSSLCHHLGSLTRTITSGVYQLLVNITNDIKTLVMN